MNLDDIRSRINPAYADTIGTESHERKWLCNRIEELERQRDELLADAERYRWLREQNETLSADSFIVLSRDVECAYCESTWVGADLDGAIEEARKAA